MSRIRFVSSLREVIEGRDHVIVFASRAALMSGGWKRIFRARWASVLQRMVEETDPGDQGRVVSTWTSSDPSRVSLAVLPDEVSRHLSPSRAHAIEHCAERAEVAASKAAGVVLLLDEPAHLLAAACAVGRAFPQFDRRSKKKRRKVPHVVALDARGRALKAPKAVADTVDAVRWAASLVDEPAADLTTAAFVEEAERHAGDLKGVASTVVVGDDLVAAGLGGLHAVGRAAAVAPRLLTLRHEPTRRDGAQARGPHVALVGKGIVFDTGGLHLKPRGFMEGMKSDMGGAAAVVGAFRALVKRRCPVPVTCLVPLAENAIGRDAYRPDDILVMHSGKTVEINNTDAEGRLVLADAVSHAARDLGADVIIDAATLTGAQAVATGKRHAAIVSNAEYLETLAVTVGRACGDLVHPLPFAPELFQREFKSHVADMRNSVKDRANAQASCAAQFVHAHLEGTKVDWLHVDLAAPARPGPRATGFGVALLAELVSALASGRTA